MYKIIFLNLLHYFSFIDLIYHLCAKFRAFPLRSVEVTNQWEVLGLDVVFDSPCVSMYKLRACYSCCNNRAPVSFRGHCHFLGSDYCYVIFPSAPIGIVYNSLYGWLRFYPYLILLIYFNGFSSGSEYIFFVCRRIFHAHA